MHPVQMRARWKKERMAATLKTPTTKHEINQFVGRNTFSLCLLTASYRSTLSSNYFTTRELEHANCIVTKIRPLSSRERCSTASLQSITNYYYDC